MMNLVIGSLMILGIVVIWYLVAFVVWSSIWIPIKKKETLVKEREKEERELDKIKAQKGVEWDQYQELSNEKASLIQANLKLKNQNEKLTTEVEKQTIQKEKLVVKNRELVKGN